MKKMIQINVRISEEENAILEKKVQERGIGKSAYIREAIVNEKVPVIYTSQFRQALEHVCALYLHIDQIDMNENQKREYKQGVEGLWHCLR